MLIELILNKIGIEIIEQIYHVKAYISVPSLVSPVGDRKSNGSDSCLGLLLLCLLKIELIEIFFKNTDIMQGFFFGRTWHHW